MRVVTTLSLSGRTEEALELYRVALGAEILFLLRFRDCPDRSLIRPGLEDKIFHATFRIGETQIMASDVCGAGPLGDTAFSGFSLAVQADTADRAEQMFNALSDGGTIQIPLAPATFTALYGIVIDRFGVSWKIMVA